MANQIFVEVGGWFFVVSCQTNAQENFQLPAQYSPFIRPELPQERQKDFLFELAIIPQADKINNDQFIGRFNEIDTPQDLYKKDNGGYHLQQFDGQNNLVGDLDWNKEANRYALSMYGNSIQKLLALNNALMIAYLFSTASRSTLLMHSSVIMYQQKGYLFLGVSGTGKSTHTALWRRYIEDTELLNDDNPVVRIKDDEVIVYGSPWSGKTPCYKDNSVTIGAFVMLEQKPNNKIVPENTFMAFTDILTSSSMILWDSNIKEGILSTINLVLSKCQIYRLGCLPNEEAARLCHSTITK